MTRVFIDPCCEAQLFATYFPRLRAPLRFPLLFLSFFFSLFFFFTCFYLLSFRNSSCALQMIANIVNPRVHPHMRIIKIGREYLHLGATIIILTIQSFILLTFVRSNSNNRIIHDSSVSFLLFGIFFIIFTDVPKIEVHIFMQISLSIECNAGEIDILSFQVLLN